MRFSGLPDKGINWKAGIVLILAILAPLVFLFGSVIIYDRDLQKTRHKEFEGKWEPLISLMAARASIVMDKNFSIDDKFASDLYLLPSLMKEIEAIVLLDNQNRPIFSVGEEVIDGKRLAEFGVRALSGEKRLIPAKRTGLGFAVSYSPVVRERAVVAAIVMAIDEGEPIFGLSSILLGLAFKATVPFILWAMIVLYFSHKKSIKDLIEEDRRFGELRLLSLGYKHENLHMLADEIAGEFSRVLRLNECIVYLRDGETGEVLPYGRRSTAENPEKNSNTVFGPGDLRLQAMADGKPKIYRLSKSGISRSPGKEIRKADNPRIAVPLAMGREIVGLADMEAREVRIDDRFLESCCRFADLAAQALKGRLANIRTEKELAEISSIVDAVEIVDSSTDLTTALGKITRLVTGFPDIRFCRIFTMDEGGVNLVLRAETWAGEGIVDDAVGATHNLEEMPMHKIAMLSGQTQELRSDDLEKHIGTNKDIYRPDMNDCLILIIPVLLGEWQIGCLSVGVAGHDDFPRELKFRLERLTHFLAASISRAQTCVRLKRSFDKLSTGQKQTIKSERLEALTHLARGVSENLTSVLKVIREKLSEINGDSSNTAANQIIREVGSKIEILDKLEKRFGLFSEIEKREGFQQLELAQMVTESLAELDDTISKFRNEKGEINITVKIHGSGQIYGNLANLKLMVKELIVNCLESLVENGEIAVETRVELHHAVLEISDNGVGMSDSVGGKMFEPFFTTKRGSGRGLGMSMVHGIVTAHNGLIDISSRPTGGNSTVIKLPLVDPEQTALYSVRKGTKGIPLSST